MGNFCMQDISGANPCIFGFKGVNKTIADGWILSYTIGQKKHPKKSAAGR